MRFYASGFVAVLVLVLAGVLPQDARAQPDYTLFESGPVRPIALP